MVSDRIALIEKWFDGQHENSDFIRADRCYAFSLIGPTATSKRVIYCTKSHVAIRAVEENFKVGDFGIICRGGLPKETDVPWLRDVIGQRELAFLGDLDPVDVLIFAWLRERLSPISVTHYGINDRFITALNVVIPKSYRIRLDKSESAAVPELDSLLDNAKETLGPACYDLLRGGDKIELEAIVSALGTSAPLLRGVGD